MSSEETPPTSVILNNITPIEKVIEIRRRHPDGITLTPEEIEKFNKAGALLRVKAKKIERALMATGGVYANTATIIAFGQLLGEIREDLVREPVIGWEKLAELEAYRADFPQYLAWLNAENTDHCADMGTKDDHGATDRWIHNFHHTLKSDVIVSKIAAEDRLFEDRLFPFIDRKLAEMGIVEDHSKDGIAKEWSL